MKSRTLNCITAMTLFAALAIPLRLAAQKQIRYTIIDVGTLGGTFSQAFVINNKGEVVGFATLTGDTALHAFLWRKGVITDLSTLAPTDTLPYSLALSINDNGDIVGFSETSVPDPLGENTCGDSLICLPVIWRDGVMTALPTLGGNNGIAIAINDRGQVVGDAETAEKDPTCPLPQVLVTKPTVWEKGEPRALPTAPFLNGLVGSNNQKGQIVGNAETCNFSAVRAYVWEKNKVVDMGTIGPSIYLAPVAINNKGQATGTDFDPATGLNRAFLWQDGVTTDLGNLPGDPQVFGNAINDRGQITGQTCDLTESTCTSFIWQNGIMTDLNAVVPANSSLLMFDPTSINSLGEIVGLAIQKTTGELRAFLAIPDNSAVAESATATAQGEAAQRPKLVLPENVRRALQQRLGHRYHIPGIVASPRD
jgi:probable HAF family extracellular repeat protein